MLQTLVAYLPTLLLTLLLEAAVVAEIARRGERALAVQVCLALNLLTHPLATLLQSDVLAIEALVVFCEWLGYAQVLRCTLPRALWFATAANAVSWFAGVVWWAVAVH